MAGGEITMGLLEGGELSGRLLQPDAARLELDDKFRDRRQKTLNQALESLHVTKRMADVVDLRLQRHTAEAGLRRRDFGFRGPRWPFRAMAASSHQL